MKAMAYEKSDRYANALELKNDLQLYLDGKSVSAKKDNLYIRTRKWIIRNKIATLGIAAALICLILGIVFTSVYENKKKQETIAALLNQAEQLFENKNYIKAYETYVAALTLAPYSQEALDGIKTAAVMAEKQKTLTKITPILDETKALSTTNREINARLESLKTQLNKLKNKTKGYEGVETKKPLWETEKQLFSANIEKLRIESEIISRYMTVLSHDGTSKEARIALSQIYYDKYQAGEVRQNQQEMAYYKALILTFDDGRFKKLLEQPAC